MAVFNSSWCLTDLWSLFFSPTLEVFLSCLSDLFVQTLELHAKFEVGEQRETSGTKNEAVLNESNISEDYIC